MPAHAAGGVYSKLKIDGCAKLYTDPYTLERCAFKLRSTWMKKNVVYVFYRTNEDGVAKVSAHASLARGTRQRNRKNGA